MDSRTKLLKMVAKAARDWNLIEDGDRILIAVSGGKDSTSLAYALAAARQMIGKTYELEALHISSDFCACCKKSALSERLSSWGIPFNDLFVPVIGRLKPGREMNCYWCSTQRRTELLKYACEKGFNKIALGHHMDDIVETFFMNMMDKGELRSMPVRLAYKKYPVSIIRPLAWLEEREIVDFADAEGILKAACTCPYGKNSARKTMRARIKEFTGASGTTKRRIMQAMASGERSLLEE
jgi:tRNA 2-thiocytidine biosynthesis protein TtcA